MVTGEQSCQWTGPNDERAVSVIVFPTRDVLSESYRLRRFAIFQPVVVSDAPAVREQSSPTSISCTITVGTSEGQGFIASYDDTSLGSAVGSGGPCGDLQRVAERIVVRLPPLPGK